MMKENLAALTNITFLNKIAYSVEEISEKTSLSKAFLRLEIKRGKLRARRFGRRVLIREEDLRDYLESGSDGGLQSDINPNG